MKKNVKKGMETELETRGFKELHRSHYMGGCQNSGPFLGPGAVL